MHGREIGESRRLEGEGKGRSVGHDKGFGRRGGGGGWKVTEMDWQREFSRSSRGGDESGERWLDAGENGVG